MRRIDPDKVRDGISFDTETFLIRPGCIAPKLVVGSACSSNLEPKLLDRDMCVKLFDHLLDTGTVIIAHNAPFDMLVMQREAERRGLDFMSRIFAKYERGEVYDTGLSEQLHALANGHMGQMSNGFTKTNYSLADCVLDRLGRDNAKENDEWCLRYSELYDVPLDQYPDTAAQYPKDDARNTYLLAVEQTKTGHVNRNMHDLAFQAYADWCLHLGADKGFTVSPKAIADLKTLTQMEKTLGEQPFIDMGLLKRVKGVAKKHTVNFKTAIAKAYGASGICPKCRGNGHVPGKSACLKSCPGESCTRCYGAGFKPITCKSKKTVNIDGDYIDDKGGVTSDKDKAAIVFGCDGTGFDIDQPGIPKTKGGGVGGDRDVLNESGCDDLLDYAAWGMKEKILSTYVPWLEKGLDEWGNVIPLNPRPSVLKATGRLGASTEHQMPREGGVRESIVAGEGKTLISCDWTGCELVCHAQNCLDIVGYSAMADALNSGVKVHDKLASEMVGVDYQHMVDNRKIDKALGDARQAAKPPNFGFPGLMGAVSLVIAQRKQGPDTLGADGRMYRGLRFCLLSGGESTCGHTKVTEWKRRSISPTCVRCIEVAEQIKETWLETWPENVKYFAHMKEFWGGEIEQSWSKRVRGDVGPCVAENGMFQGLAGDMMKLAVIRITKECYLDRTSDLYGTRPIIPIHDELIAEADDDKASDAAKRISQIMVETMQELCPDLKAAAEAEPALMKVLCKDAEPVYDDNGNLCIWYPTVDKT